MAFFRLIARQGRLLLIVGLLTGIFVPGLAATMKPWLPEIVATLLFLAALRVGPRAALGALADLKTALLLLGIFQLLLPLAVVTIFWSFGLTGPIATALILVCTASAISGSPNLTIMLSHDPSLALRLLVIGTAILPLTCLPVFYLVPQLADSGAAVLSAAGRMLLVIGGAGTVAFFARARLAPNPGPDFYTIVDACSAFMMAVIILALMSAVYPAWQDNPANLLLIACIAFAANYGLQILGYFTMGRAVTSVDRTSVAVSAGNRNMALFLTALPASVTDPMLIFIGCYQIPMYLTPIAMRWLYSKK